MIQFKQLSILFRLNLIQNDTLYCFSPGKLSKLSILFKHDSFISLKRSETNTMSNFLASFGGLLGLFMGFSVLSMVEMVYFFTLRLFYKIKQHKTSDNNART